MTVVIVTPEALSISAHDKVLRCKNIRISTDILWRVFLILTEPVPYTFVSVNRRIMKPGSTLNVGPGFIIPVPLKYETRQKISADIRIFLQCVVFSTSNVARYGSETPSVRFAVDFEH